jgi:hypothetical protein
MTISEDDSHMESFRIEEFFLFWVNVFLLQNACDSPISLLLVQALLFQEQITLTPL